MRKKNGSDSGGERAETPVNKDDALVDRYEEIRRTFFGRHQGTIKWGLVVLRTKGMAAWARSWQEYCEGGVRHTPSVPSVSTASLHFPSNSEEVVRVLAGMVWAIQEEVIP